MTDQEKLLALFLEFGLTPRIGRLDADPRTVYEGPHPERTTLEFQSGDPKVRAYMSFECVFEFLEDGSFYSIGIWE